jgi:hypothetical protein
MAFGLCAVLSALRGHARVRCSLVNRTSGIAPCAVRMVYIFKSQVYYDDRAAPLCNHQDENQRSAIANLPLLDRHLRSVIRWGAPRL